MRHMRAAGLGLPTPGLQYCTRRFNIEMAQKIRLQVFRMNRFWNSVKLIRIQLVENCRSSLNNRNFVYFVSQTRRLPIRNIRKQIYAIEPAEAFFRRLVCTVDGSCCKTRFRMFFSTYYCRASTPHATIVNKYY